MQVFKYEQSLENLLKSKEKIVFLAGPTVRAHQRHLGESWRVKAIKEFEKQGFLGHLIVPEFEDITESDKGCHWLPAWEFRGLCNSDAIMFWIPRTKDLIGLVTNHEFGFWLGHYPQKMIYGRPEGSYRNDYLDLMWDYINNKIRFEKRKICTTLEETIEETIKIATYSIDFGYANRLNSPIIVESPYGIF